MKAREGRCTLDIDGECVPVSDCVHEERVPVGISACKRDIEILLLACLGLGESEVVCGDCYDVVECFIQQCDFCSCSSF